MAELVEEQARRKYVEGGPRKALWPQAGSTGEHIAQSGRQENRSQDLPENITCLGHGIRAWSKGIRQAQARICRPKRGSWFDEEGGWAIFARQEVDFGQGVFCGLRQIFVVAGETRLKRSTRLGAANAAKRPNG